MSTPTWTNSAFRAAFPEFADLTKYPEAQLTMWSGVAQIQVNACRWGSQTLFGWQLYVAHEVTLAAQNQKAASVGGVPGGTSGPTSSKTVGSVTVQYDTQSTAEKDAGWWNLTTYGKQFIRLARMFGAGPVQL